MSVELLKINSHTLNVICLPHDNATALCWQFYQHHNDNRIGVNNRKKLPKPWYTSINFRQELAKGWEGGKTVALSGKKRKTESRDSSVKLTSWFEPRSPIQCVRTSFPASFVNLAGRKNISSLHSLVGQHFEFHVSAVDFGCTWQHRKPHPPGTPDGRVPLGPRPVQNGDHSCGYGL